MFHRTILHQLYIAFSTFHLSRTEASCLWERSLTTGRINLILTGKIFSYEELFSIFKISQGCRYHNISDSHWFWWHFFSLRLGNSRCCLTEWYFQGFWVENASSWASNSGNINLKKLTTGRISLIILPLYWSLLDHLKQLLWSSVGISVSIFVLLLQNVHNAD